MKSAEMKPHLAIAAMLLGISLTTGTAQAQDAGDNGWHALFNGVDLTGWTQLNGEASYTVDHGEIVGTTVTNTPNSFLATEQTYGDFLLELELWVDPAINSGLSRESVGLPALANPDRLS